MADRMIPIDDAIAHLKGKKTFLQGQLGIARIPLAARNARGEVLDEMVGNLQRLIGAGQLTIDASEWRDHLRAKIDQSADTTEMLEGLISEIDGDAIGAGGGGE
jgi:hypothetical protein